MCHTVGQQASHLSIDCPLGLGTPRSHDVQGCVGCGAVSPSCPSPPPCRCFSRCCFLVALPPPPPPTHTSHPSPPAWGSRTRQGPSPKAGTCGSSGGGGDGSSSSGASCFVCNGRCQQAARGAHAQGMHVPRQTPVPCTCRHPAQDALLGPAGAGRDVAIVLADAPPRVDREPAGNLVDKGHRALHARHDLQEQQEAPAGSLVWCTLTHCARVCAACQSVTLARCRCAPWRGGAGWPAGSSRRTRAWWWWWAGGCGRSRSDVAAPRDRALLPATGHCVPHQQLYHQASCNGFMTTAVLGP